jgi:serine protease AprX
VGRLRAGLPGRVVREMFPDWRRATLLSPILGTVTPVKPAFSPRISRRSPPRHWLRFAIVLVCAFALGAPLTAGADSAAQTTLSPGLLEAAQAEPDETFRVIVEGAVGTAVVSERVRAVTGGDEAALRSFLTVPAVAGTLTGSQIVALADGSEPLVITRDSPVVATDDPRPEEPTAPGTSEEPTVAGDAEPGHWLTATPGTWSGSGTPGHSFQWERCGRALTPSEVSGHHEGCVAIPGASEEAYRVTADDLGLSLRVVVTGVDGGDTRVAASGLTQLVTAEPPVALFAPSIVGTAEEGQTLNAANGIWDGTEPLEVAHQWKRCDPQGENCADIVGAAGPSYTVGPGDVGGTIRLAVSASGLGGKLLVLSEATDAVVAIPEPQPRFKQHWPYVAGVASLLSSSQGQALEPPTIAIVDSGIDAGRADFGGRVIEQANVSTREGNQPGDGYGHGTAVASVAAGEAEGYVGAAPDARLVAVEALDDGGVAYLSDVITAADWIYLNRERLNIRVANFSLHGTTVASLATDPLDRAVERLWLSGIVVVAAAGNYAVDGEESFVPFAPGNDPFVLTVGATDTRGSFTQRDDIAAPWSAWGYTRDGFAKPELGAPGRYIAAAVSADTKLARTRPERIVEPGYLQLSGTSLAAPAVAGTAANLLAAHPDWTPDQVKGALMLTAEPLARARPRSSGVGALNAARAAAAADPPNPNLALQRFLVPDPSGGSTPVFDAAGWTTVAQSDPAWASVAWGSVAWGSAAWSSVAWGSVAWGSVAWGSVAWGSVAWGSNSEDDLRQEGGYWVRRN